MHHILCGMGKKHSKPKKQKNCTDNNQDLNESLCQRIHENPIFCVDIYGNNLLSGNSIGVFFFLISYLTVNSNSKSYICIYTCMYIIGLFFDVLHRSCTTFL